MIWFETGDLFVHFNWNMHPTGIQRVALEILRAAQARYPGRVGFCRLSWHTGRFEQVDFARIAAISMAPDEPEHRSRGWVRRVGTVSRQIRRTLWRYPSMLVRDHLIADRAEREFGGMIAKGDWLICLGVPWRYTAYGTAIEAAKRRYGFRFGLLIHDLIAVTHPQFCKPGYAAAFPPWLATLYGACDLILTASNYCAGTVREFARERGWPLPGLARIPFGAGYSDAGSGDATRLDVPVPFVLFVSSFQRRKNHALLFRIWRTLLRRHGADAVPTLIFVGSGSPAAVMPEASADDGKIIVIRGASDATLRDLYRRCLFTVYPSLVEGWGLPVAESLSFGKFCIASNRTSVPEVGGDLVDYFDPDNEAEATAAIERALFDPAYLAARTARVAADYRAPNWEDCAAALIAAVDAATEAEAAATPPISGASVG